MANSLFPVSIAPPLVKGAEFEIASQLAGGKEKI